MLKLKPEQLQEIKSILHVHLPAGQTALVFGSRAVAPGQRQPTKPHSDIDIALMGPALPLHAMFELREAFSESNLPFRTDICHYTDLPPAWRNSLYTEHID